MRLYGVLWRMHGVPMADHRRCIAPGYAVMAYGVAYGLGVVLWRCVYALGVRCGSVTVWCATTSVACMAWPISRLWRAYAVVWRWVCLRVCVGVRVRPLGVRVLWVACYGVCWRWCPLWYRVIAWQLYGVDVPIKPSTLTNTNAIHYEYMIECITYSIAIHSIVYITTAFGS